MKSAYQRGLDKKGARFIKEKNNKTGVHNQHKVLKGIKENEIDNILDVVDHLYYYKNLYILVK